MKPTRVPLELVKTKKRARGKSEEPDEASAAGATPDAVTERDDDAAPAPAVKRQRKGGVKNPALIGRKFTGGANASMFIRQWAWKREMKTDEERFELDYEHECVDANGERRELRFRQSKFDAHGFASTVWDSSIVMAKYLERHREALGKTAKSACEIGAGCGVATCVLALSCGIDRVVATELNEDNLELLRENCSRLPDDVASRIECKKLKWGDEEDVDSLGAAPFFDLVVATDVVYYEDAMEDLVATLEKISEPKKTRILFSYGRNRQALGKFLRLVEGKFDVAEVPRDECDPLYQCTDVDVIELTRRSAL
jgi:predicted nicotinamide N-methyase